MNFKLTYLSITLLLISSCSSFKRAGMTPVEKPVEAQQDNTIVRPSNETVQKNAPQKNYHIDLNKELIYSDEIVHINELNKFSAATGDKTSQSQLLDALFANKNRSSKDIKVSYLKLIRKKKSDLRRKINEKRTLFFKDQKERRSEYTAQANLKKKNFDYKNATHEAKKNFYKNLDSERKLFFASEKDASKVFDSNIKSLEQEIKSRFLDMDKDFEERLKIFKAENN